MGNYNLLWLTLRRVLYDISEEVCPNNWDCLYYSDTCFRSPVDSSVADFGAPLGINRIGVHTREFYAILIS